MGGYGGTSNRKKEKTYYDTGGYKVKDKNAIKVGEYFIDRGKYVAFLQEKPNQKRADLSVDGIHIEVKGMSSLSTDQVSKNIKKGFKQVEADNFRYPENSHREGQVIILSEYSNIRDAYKIVYGGYRTAKRKGYVHGEVKLMHNGKMYNIGGRK